MFPQYRMTKYGISTCGSEYVLVDHASRERAIHVSRFSTLGFFSLQLNGILSIAMRTPPTGPLLYCTVLCNILHFLIVWVDPGYVPLTQTQQSEYAYDSSNSRYCEKCSMVTPLRTKHCSKCGRCVARYDHHCYWLVTCIGSRNHSLFIVYLFLLTFTTANGVGQSYSVIRNEGVTQSWDDYIWLNLSQLGAVVSGSFFILFIGLLALGHVVMACHGFTTYEFASGHKIDYLKKFGSGHPFDFGVIANVRNFLWKTDPRSEWRLRGRESIV